MKKIMFFLILLTYGLITNAQEGDQSLYPDAGNDEYKTIFGNKKNGGYGGIHVGYMYLNETDAIVAGGQAAWIVGHSFGLGVAGRGFINDYQYNAFNEKYSLTGGYGGLLIEPIILPKFPVHLSFPVIVGAGGIATAIWQEYGYEENHYVEDADVYFAFQPGVELELNLTKFFRMSLGVNYLYTTDVELTTAPPDVLNGFNGGISFKFGIF